MQAIFNFMSCSAVAMAKMYGGSNALLVTGLIMVAHMVSCPGSSAAGILLHLVAGCTHIQQAALHCMLPCKVYHAASQPTD